MNSNEDSSCGRTALIDIIYAFAWVAFAYDGVPDHNPLPGVIAIIIATIMAFAGSLFHKHRYGKKFFLNCFHQVFFSYLKTFLDLLRSFTFFWIGLTCFLEIIFPTGR